MKWMVSATPRPLYPVKEIRCQFLGGWVGLVLDWRGKFRTPPSFDLRTAQTVASRYRLRLPGPWILWPEILKHPVPQICLQLWVFMCPVHTELKHGTRGAEKVLVFYFVEKLPPCMLLRNLLLWLLNSATAPRRTKFKFSLPIHIPCFKIDFNIVLTKAPL
jgi:hypothetical protein